ncbi:MAG: hypothetical protein K0U54_12450 [Bacteroidetes bacterium]|nr:hypothetical protein [Bacteroidota bacterium]
MSENKILDFSHFIERTAMYVTTVNQDTIVSFIHGYEYGLANNTFTTSIRNRLTDHYGVIYSSDGWSGQIKRLAESINLSWIETFKKVASELD